MADLMTFEERKGRSPGEIVAWCGDGNNVATSWIHAAVRFGFELRLACPDALQPAGARCSTGRRGDGGRVSVTDDPHAAAARRRLRRHRHLGVDGR